MKHIFWNVSYWLLAVLVGLRCWRGYQLGTYVVYRGGVWWLFQGVCCPLWDLKNITSGEIKHNVHESMFRKQRTLANYFNGVGSGYRWYMTSWHRINVERKMAGGE